MRHFLIVAGVWLGIFVVLNVLWFANTTEWKKRGCYLWRTRKPHAFFGLPVIGRHNAYVGITSSRFNRDLQHIHGGSMGTPPAPWSDLSPRAYALPCYFPGWEFARRVQETFWMLVFWPVYNDQKNHWNPRRIPRRYAYVLKARRQAGGRRFNLALAMVRAPFTVALYAGAWLAVQHWT